MNGLKIAFKEHSFIAEVLGGLILIPYIILVDFNNLLKFMIISVYLLLLAFELLNTAIEKLSDKVSKDYDDDIKKMI